MLIVVLNCMPAAREPVKVLADQRPRQACPSCESVKSPQTIPRKEVSAGRTPEPEACAGVGFGGVRV